MNAVSPVLILFFFMLTGFISAKVKISGPEMAAHFSKFVVNIGLPALLFTTFQRPFSFQLLGEAGMSFAMSILVYGISFLIAFFYPKLLGIKSPERGVHRYVIIISNCGYMGYPMVEALLGPAFLFHAVIFNIPFNFLAFTVCAWIIAKEGKQPFSLNWKMLFNPNVAATILGLLFFLFSIKLPDPLYRSLKSIGDMASPLMMIITGITLAQTSFRKIFGSPLIYVTSAARLLVIPVLFGFIFYIMGIMGVPGIRGALFTMAVLITAMPAGSSAAMLALLYKTAEEEAGSLVFLSTILSIITIPAIMIFTEYLNR